MTPADVLRRMGVTILEESAGSAGSAFCLCPECGKPKFYMYVDRWPFHAICFGSGEHLRSTLPGLWARREGTTYREAVRTVGSMLGMENPVSDACPSPSREEVRTVESLPGEWRRLTREDGSTPHAGWLKGRGLKWRSVHDAEVMWDGNPMSHWVIFPVHEMGRIVSYEKRCIVPKSEWRYGGQWRKTMTPPGVRNSMFLYGLDTLAPGDDIVLCEGIPDWFSLRQAGFNVAATFGSSPTERQISLLAPLRPSLLVLGFDADRAGLKAFARASSMAGRLLPGVPVEPWFIPGRDANDVGDPRLLRISYNDRRAETVRAMGGMH